MFFAEVGLFFAEDGLFFAEVGLFSAEVGLFFAEVGLFSAEVGLGGAIVGVQPLSTKAHSVLMPRLTQLDHGSVCVGDVDEAVVFYRDVLGLAPVPRPDFGFPGAWFDAGGIPVHLTTDGSLRGAESPVRANESHLAFRVDDLEAMIERLDEHGVAVWELPDSPAALRQVFFNDPWGNMIEMIVY